MPDADPIADYLRTVPGTDRMRAAAWDAAYAPDDADAENRLRQLSVGDDVRAKLWDLREGTKTEDTSLKVLGHEVTFLPEPVKNAIVSWGKAGPRRVKEGIGEVASGEFSRGAHDILAGTGITAAPMAIPAAVKALAAAPLTTLAGTGAGVAAGGAASVGGKYVAEKAGATPDQAQLVGDVAGISAGLGAASLARRAMDALPNFARAGENFGKVMSQARQEPVDIRGPGKVALRIQELADRGAPMPQVVRKFLVRVTDPERPELTYEEARDFYSNISRLSANETQRLTPVVAAQVTKLRVALDKALEDTAARVGQAPAYRSAMTEYARAAKLRSTAEKASDVMVRKVLPSGVAGAAAYKGYQLFRDGP